MGRRFPDSAPNLPRNRAHVTSGPRPPAALPCLARLPYTHPRLPNSAPPAPRSASMIFRRPLSAFLVALGVVALSTRAQDQPPAAEDRKSTRLNSSHLGISYAVFCLKKKN